MMRGDPLPPGESFDWATRPVYVGSATGILPMSGLPPGTQLAYLSSVNFSDGETPAGVVDGVNKIFTLAHAPTPASSLQLYLGEIQNAGGNDYTLAGNTITFTIAPHAPPLAWYRY